MSKYFEGYYCKDDSSVEGIRTDTSRQVLRTISSHYPLGVTVDEISKQTEIPSDTIRSSLGPLEDAGFISKTRYGKNRGRPGKNDVHADVRSYRFHIENRNFALKDDNYQFAPGYTKYTSDFLYAWNQLVEKNQLDDVYSLLIKILRPVMTRITSSGDPILKQLRPNAEKSMLCQFCGVNHDARDFIRATLLHILDQFETSSMFKDFFNEEQFISRDMNLIPIQEKSKIEEQTKEWLDNLAPDARGIAESIVEKSTFSIEQLMSRVNKLTGEQHFNEPQALFLIADELRVNLADSKLPQHQRQPISLEVTVINVEQTQTKDGIKITLHKVDFAADYTAAFLTVEKTSDDRRSITFYHSKSMAIQGDYEFKVTSKGPNYKSFRKNIHYGTIESGTVKFERLHYNESDIIFEFQFGEATVFGGPRLLFVFEVQIHK